MTEFKVPELGENVAGGDVMRVMVNVGDTVARDQPVLELETDKATIEVPSTVAGTVKEIRVKKGDKIKVGAVVLTVDEGAAGGNGAIAPRGGQERRQAERRPATTTEGLPPRNRSRLARPVRAMPRSAAPEPPAPPPAPASRAEGNGARGPSLPHHPPFDAWRVRSA